MRPHQDLRRRIRIADIREQEQRQEPTASTVHVDPPLSIHVVAAIDVPTCVSRILHAWEPNRNGSTDSFVLNPTGWSEKRVVRLPERRRLTRRCESRTFGAGETDDGLGPGLGIARVDDSRPQLVFDDVHARTYSVGRHSTPHDKESIRAEIVNGCHQLLWSLRSRLCLVQQVDALAARYRGVIDSRDAFHVGPVGGFPVARVAQHHAVLVEGVEVALPSPVPELRSHLRNRPMV